VNILVLGCGGREHDIIKKIKVSPKAGKVFVLSESGSAAFEAQCLRGSPMDASIILSAIETYNIDFTIVSQDSPLVAGIADRIREKGCAAFGPTGAAAQIEGSKIFAKNLMRKHNIPTADYDIFDDPEQVLRYIVKKNTYPTVIKADGLAFGKGVVIANDYGQSEEAVTYIMKERRFGESGNKIVIEEYLDGPEVTVLSFTDSNTIVTMVSSMDHKRAFDSDIGPNTGGMGVIAPNPFFTEEISAWCMKNIFEPTIKAMKSEGIPFKGCLYFGLMLTKDGPKVIEYNCRFGDPEAQAILPLLKTDLLSIMLAIENETLSQIDIEFMEAASCCVVLASKGYPGHFEKGFQIHGLDEISTGTEVFVCHAGTVARNGGYATDGGRVLSVTALDKTLDGAISRAYTEVDKIRCAAMYCRRDIGGKALAFLKSQR
jgi:phosphoribosylamine--glycine ligase